MSTKYWCQKCKCPVHADDGERCPQCRQPLTKIPTGPRKAWPGKPPGMQRPPRGDGQKPI